MWLCSRVRIRPPGGQAFVVKTTFLHPKLANLSASRPLVPVPSEGTPRCDTADMLIEPLLRDPSPQAARSAARWKCLLLAILLGTCSISIIVSLPSRAAARGKAALLASTAADVEPEASLSHVAPASSADADGFVIPPPCLSVMAVELLSGTVLLVSLTAAVPAMGFLEDGVAAESIAATWQATIGKGLTFTLTLTLTLTLSTPLL